MQSFRVYLSKAAWTFGLSCGKVQKSRLRLVITWLCVDSILGVKYYLIPGTPEYGPTQSVVQIFELNFVQICLGAPGSCSFRKQGCFFSSYGKRLFIIIDLFEGLSLVGAHFRR